MTFRTLVLMCFVKKKKMNYGHRYRKSLNKVCENDYNKTLTYC